MDIHTVGHTQVRTYIQWRETHEWKYVHTMTDTHGDKRDTHGQIKSQWDRHGEIDTLREIRVHAGTYTRWDIHGGIYTVEYTHG